MQESEITDFYWKNEQSCRKFTKFLAFNYIFLLSLVFMGLFVYSIYLVLVGRFDSSALIMPYNMVVPFDTETIWGWYLLWVIQIMNAFSYSTCVLTITSYFVCTCIYIDSICKHFELILDLLERNIEQIQDIDSTCISPQQRAQKSLNQAVQIHVKIYE